MWYRKRDSNPQTIRSKRMLYTIPAFRHLLVLSTGLEPARPLGHKPLMLACIPIPSQEQEKGRHVYATQSLPNAQRNCMFMNSCAYYLVQGIDKRPIKTGSTGNNTNRDVLVFVITFYLSVY